MPSPFLLQLRKSVDISRAAALCAQAESRARSASAFVRTAYERLNHHRPIDDASREVLLRLVGMAACEADQFLAFVDDLYSVLGGPDGAPSVPRAAPSDPAA
jgi:hypothetical protein